MDSQLFTDADRGNFDISVDDEAAPKPKRRTKAIITLLAAAVIAAFGFFAWDSSRKSAVPAADPWTQQDRQQIQALDELLKKQPKQCCP